MNESRSVLFLCTGNSCRSQMAEGLARELVGSHARFYSAGIEKHGMNPLAVQVMAEIGVDISGQQSQLVLELPVANFHRIFTVCGHAHENCPVLPGAGPVIHQGFDDPPRLTRNMEDKDKILAVYRRVRDEIRDWVTGLPNLL